MSAIPSENLSPFNFVYDNNYQNYSNCDIAGSFYEVQEYQVSCLKRWYMKFLTFLRGT